MRRRSRRPEELVKVKLSLQQYHFVLLLFYLLTVFSVLDCVVLVWFSFERRRKPRRMSKVRVKPPDVGDVFGNP